MKLSEDTSTETFRGELRTWLEANRPKPEEITERPRSTGHLPDWARAWQRRLFDSGWLMPAWPSEHGGRSASAEEELAYFEEVARAHVHRTYNSQGLVVVAPTLLVYGNEQQKEQFALPTLRAEISWCLGISEPGAGSDLGSLSTRADLHGDTFVVNGQKVWTSGALDADYCWCLVRTDQDARKHAGISLLMVDMTTPGIEVRPLAELDDPRHTDFNEVFFTDVEVPAERLVGEINKGWRIAMGSVTRDRVLMWLSDLTSQERNLERFARSPSNGRLEVGRRIGDDPCFRDVFAAHYVDVLAMRCMSTRGLQEYSKGTVTPAQSFLKVYGAELTQSLYLTVLEWLGPALWSSRSPRMTPSREVYPVPGPPSTSSLLSARSAAGRPRCSATSSPNRFSDCSRA